MQCPSAASAQPKSLNFASYTPNARLDKPTADRNNCRSWLHDRCTRPSSHGKEFVPRSAPIALQKLQALFDQGWGCGAISVARLWRSMSVCTARDARQERMSGLGRTKGDWHALDPKNLNRKTPTKTLGLFGPGLRRFRILATLGGKSTEEAYRLEDAGFRAWELKVQDGGLNGLRFQGLGILFPYEACGTQPRFQRDASGDTPAVPNRSHTPEILNP